MNAKIEPFVKALHARPSEWPYAMEGVVCAYRVSKLVSAKLSPFFLMYNRQPALSVDVKYSLNRTVETSENDQTI